MSRRAPKKFITSFYLSPEAVRAMKRLRSQLDLPKSRIVELALLRLEAERQSTGIRLLVDTPVD